jgi:cytochrome P450
MGAIVDIVQEHYLTILIGLVVVLFLSSKSTKKASNEPPMVPYSIPFLGNAIPYGIDPVQFLKDCQKKYGDCFTFLMMGRKMTFCLNPDGNHFLFNVPLANASAEGAYAKLTVPVFGSEVVYDVENAVFMEQKKFVKDAFTVQAFKKYVGLIREETIQFFNELPSNQSVIFDHMSELTIRTASSCLMGKEIRSQLHSNVAQLYHDLDAGLAPINVFFRWLPLPKYFARDRANRIMTETFRKIIDRRRANNDHENNDVLQALMTATYKDGSKVHFVHVDV